MKIGVQFMKTKSERITGDIYILADIQYNDVLADNVVVKEFVMTRIYGLILRDLIVEKDAMVYLHGKVLGEIINRGGTVHIFEAGGNVRTIL